jgi:hypothetical protein
VCLNIEINKTSLRKEIVRETSNIYGKRGIGCLCGCSLQFFLLSLGQSSSVFIRTAT